MVRVALAQLNLTVGDIDGNSARLIDAIRKAAADGAQVVVTPELSITGYPPEDLVLRHSFVHANRAALDRVAASTGEVMAVVGYVDSAGDSLFNAAAICNAGRVVATYHKQLLPNYGVFDEGRYFTPGLGHTLIQTPEGVIGVCVCEDAWSPDGPVVSQGDAGAQIVININASPWHRGKVSERIDMLGERARRANASIVYVNMVGGQDELVFDGGSLVIGPDGSVVARLDQFTQDLVVVDVPLGESREVHGNVNRVDVELPTRTEVLPEPPIARTLEGDEEVYRGLQLALRDYAAKNSFNRIVLGLSGGIDSSLVATIAADALGPSNVLGVAMPSRFSSTHSLEDAKGLAGNLGIEFIELPITPTMDSYYSALESAFGPTESGLAEENIQARIRGNLLMAISNRYGHLVVATGNKSEMAVGYSTLYGDMSGGFALLKDVFKTDVYLLSRWRNAQSAVIPDNVLSKSPSAELRPDQKDSDSLPEYSVLDAILERYIEDDASASEIAVEGFDPVVVERVAQLVDRSEYKRRQAPPGPKVTTKAFGRDRRLPITNQWPELTGPDR